MNLGTFDEFKFLSLCFVYLPSYVIFNLLNPLANRQLHKDVTDIDLYCHVLILLNAISMTLVFALVTPVIAAFCSSQIISRYCRTLISEPLSDHYIPFNNNSSSTASPIC